MEEKSLIMNSLLVFVCVWDFLFWILPSTFIACEKLESSSRNQNQVDGSLVQVGDG
jgi:hypothetical protein